MAKWRDLEAQGVRRCCVIFKSGKQCRRRAGMKGDGGSSWCDKHDKAMASIKKSLECSVCGGACKGSH